MSKICVLGEKSFILPFRGVGATPFSASNREEALAALEKIVALEGPVVLLVSESIARLCRQELALFRREARGIVLSLSGDSKALPRDYEELRSFVTHAAGVDLLGRPSGLEPLDSTRGPESIKGPVERNSSEKEA